MTYSPVLLIDDAIADLALAEEALETNQLRELLALIDGTLGEVGHTNMCSSATMTDHLLDMRNLLSVVLEARVS